MTLSTAWLAVWLAACVLLVRWGWRTARTPRDALPDLPGYLSAWSDLHGGYQPGRSRLVGGWLAMTYQTARPLASRGVAPAVVTAAGVLVSAGAVLAASAGGRWPVVAAAAVLAVGVLDGLDGCVAVLTGRVSRTGALLDAIADRLTDVAFLAALWLAGAGQGGVAGLVVVAGVATGLLEYTRARAGGLGLADVGVVTWGERPTRLVLTVLGLLVAGLLPAAAGTAALAAASALAVVGAVGWVQLLVAARRSLR